MDVVGVFDFWVSLKQTNKLSFGSFYAKSFAVEEL